MKRIFLFLITNILILTAITFVLQLTGAETYLVNKFGVYYKDLMLYSLVFGFSGSLISLMLSKTLAKKMMRVELLDENHEVYKMVAELSKKANIKTPEVGVYVANEINAFATGPSKNNSLVAVSTGLFQKFNNRDEFNAVLAHEISHIANGDMVTMTLLQGVLNTFVIFASRVFANILDRKNNFYFLFVIFFQIIFGFLASIVVAWFSRQREFRADAGGAKLVGKSHMINALEKLKYDQNNVLKSPVASMQITGIKGLFSTHPPLEKRIEALHKSRY